MNLNREVWEGWTPQKFIDELKVEMEMIMTGASWRKPFRTRKQMTDYIRENQPYYKKEIPEVNEYFVNLYSEELKG